MLLRVRSGLRLWALLILLHFGGLLVLLCLRNLVVGLWLWSLSILWLLLLLP